MSGDSEQIEARLRSVNEAAQKLRAPWIVLVSTIAYLALSAGSVSDRDLLFETAIKLPILNVDLGLVTFAWVAPALLIVFHFYFLLHVSYLSEKAIGYRAAFAAHRGLSSDRLTIEEQLDVGIFAQPMGSSSNFGKFRSSRLPTFVVLSTTVIVGPIVVLGLLLVTFLPYQSPMITWWHRIILFVDLATIIWALPLLFLTVARPSERHRKGVARKNASARLTGSACALWLWLGFILFATIPHEMVSELTDRSVERLFRAHLVIRGVVLTNSDLVEQLDKRDVTSGSLPGSRAVRLLHARNLRYAQFNGSDLRRFDFSGSDLRGAQFDGAYLDRAIFSCRDTPALSDDEVRRRRGALDSACTNLTKATFVSATANGISLAGANAPGASFSGAKLIGTRFDGAELVGGTFVGTDLRGASFKSADLLGSIFLGTRAEGADFESAILNATVFSDAILTGANLQRAYLTDTEFIDSQMQGVDLKHARYERTAIVFSYVWNTKVVRGDLESALRDSSLFVVVVRSLPVFVVDRTPIFRPVRTARIGKFGFTLYDDILVPPNSVFPLISHGYPPHVDIDKLEDRNTDSISFYLDLSKPDRPARLMKIVGDNITDQSTRLRVEDRVKVSLGQTSESNLFVQIVEASPAAKELVADTYYKRKAERIRRISALGCELEGGGYTLRSSLRSALRTLDSWPGFETLRQELLKGACPELVRIVGEIKMRQ